MNQPQNPNQWNNQWHNGPTPPDQPGQAQPPQYQQQWHNGPSQPQQPGQQYQQQWQQQPNVPPATEPKKKSPLLKILILVVVLALGAAAGLWAYKNTPLGDKLNQAAAKAKAEMSYLSASDPGPEAFMGSLNTPNSEEVISKSQFRSGAVRGGVEGSTDNIYGGTGMLSVCDAEALKRNLSSNDALNGAFAQGVGINAEDVPDYIDTLTARILMQDTWVTNHGFQDGRANPFQAVLQRGTAVLTDANGVPRVRCSCGNPLDEAWDGYTAPSTVEGAWDGYAPNNVIAIYDGGEPVTAQQLVDTKHDRSYAEEGDPEKAAKLRKIMDAVTDETPKTVPADMNVQPDEELLNSRGMKIAEAGDERPTGGERWAGFESGFSAKAQGAGSDESEADGSESSIDVEALKPQIANMTVTDIETGKPVTLSNGHYGDALEPIVEPGKHTYVGKLPSPGEEFDPSTIIAKSGDLDGDRREEILLVVKYWCGCTSPANAKLFVLDQDLNILGDVDVASPLMDEDLQVIPYDLGTVDIDGDLIVAKFRARRDSDPMRLPSQILEVSLKWDGGKKFSVVGEPNIYPNPSDSLDRPS